MSLVLVLSPNTECPRPIHWSPSLDPMLPQQWPNPDYCYLEPVSRMKTEQLHQMAVSTHHNLGGHVIQLTSHLSDVESYWGFQGYSPFHVLRATYPFLSSMTISTCQKNYVLTWFKLLKYIYHFDCIKIFTWLNYTFHSIYSNTSPSTKHNLPNHLFKKQLGVLRATYPFSSSM